MSSKCRNVQKLDVDFYGKNFKGLRGRRKQIHQKREIWKIRGWGFHATREYIETSTDLTADSDDRG
jgi:hypothetical protein